MNPALLAAIVLAAGGSRRLGTPKQLVVWEGTTLVERALRLALASQPSCCRVVVGHRADEVASAAALAGVERVECPRWELGMGESLVAGLAGLPGEIEGVLVLTCDQVDLDEAHVVALAAAWREEPSRAVASGYAGVAGVPAILPRAWWPEIVASCGGSDRGAREVLRARASDVVIVDAPGLEADVDEPGEKGVGRLFTPFHARTTCCELKSLPTPFSPRTTCCELKSLPTPYDPPHAEQ